MEERIIIAASENMFLTVRSCSRERIRRTDSRIEALEPQTKERPVAPAGSRQFAKQKRTSVGGENIY